MSTRPVAPESSDSAGLLFARRARRVVLGLSAASVLLVGSGAWLIHPSLGLIAAGGMIWWDLRSMGEP